MRLVPLTALLLALNLGSAAAQSEDAELKRLQTILTILNQELLAEYQHIQALQEARRSNAQVPLYLQGRSPDLVSVDAAAADQRRAVQREEALNAQLDALYARIGQIEAEKQPILERLREIVRSAPAAAPAAVR